MSSSSTESDRANSYIEFKTLEQCRDKSSVTLVNNPAVTPSEESGLHDDISTTSRLLPRDYLLVYSPKHFSWQHDGAQKEFSLELFHHDTVVVPAQQKTSSKRRTSSRDEKMQKYHLQGMSQQNVATILKKNFQLSIPLDMQSSADHWLPLPILYSVEVKLDTWDDRVALFFDGNIQNSLAPLRKRVDTYEGKMKRKLLGERYLEIWRGKWTRDEVSTLEPASESPPNSPAKLTVATNSPPIDLSGLRGRKRRSQLRRAKKIQEPKDKDKPLEQLSGSNPLTIVLKRGRAKRRDRRRGISFMPSHDKDASEVKSIPTVDPMPLETEYTEIDALKYWKLDTGDIPKKYPANKTPITMRISFEDETSAEDSHGNAVEITAGTTPAIRGGVPNIYFKPKDGVQASGEMPKRYRVISYSNHSPDYKLDPEKPISDNSETYSSEEIEANVVEVTQEVENYEIHVADLFDEVKMNSKNDYYPRTFISAVEANPTVPQILGPREMYQQKDEPQSGHERNQYWHKFSVLLVGYNTAWNMQDRPYSDGYGIHHSRPTIITKENKWGFQDADSALPIAGCSWRPGWTFEMLQSPSISCQCSWKEIQHDLNSCKNLSRPTIGVDSYIEFSHRQPEEFLDNVLFFAHCPFELLYKQLTLATGNDSELIRGEDPSQSASSATSSSSSDSSSENNSDCRDLFKTSMCHFMGFGVRKNIQKGFEFLILAAEKGSLLAKGTLPSLLRSYDYHPASLVQVPNWLFGAAKAGSTRAVAELQTLDLDKYNEVVDHLNLSLTSSDHKDLKYREHIQPSFDLENNQSLSQSVEKWKLKNSNNTETKDILFNQQVCVLTKIGEGWGSRPPRFYLFGSLLHIASSFGFAEAVSYLLDQGYDINGRSSMELFRTPLLCALGHGHANVAQILIQRGADCKSRINLSDGGKFEVTPGPLHYLINIQDVALARDLAISLTANGADLNYKCAVKGLMRHFLNQYPVLRGRSITPLRLAMINGRSGLVKILLNLGAKFAREMQQRDTYISGPSAKQQEGTLLLETPCTDLEILRIFFTQAQAFGLPAEFSQTPLGLLISEDDGPERRLRPGFESFAEVKEALILLLELQPGYEKETLWSAARHDHLEIARYLLQEFKWSVEMRYRGLTLLHTAILHGRVEMAQLLISEGADILAVTDTRNFTCLHLLMLGVRDTETDLNLFSLIRDGNIDINAKDRIDGLTVLHLAVRNKKFHLLRLIIERDIDWHSPVADKIEEISQGRSAWLARVPTRPKIFSTSLTIMGEVLIQFVQDRFYSFGYVAELLDLYFDSLKMPLALEDIVIDKGNGMTILHLLAMAEHSKATPRPRKADHNMHHYNDNRMPQYSSTVGASLLQKTIARFPKELLNVPDNVGDTPLHYACAANQLHNIRTLIDNGADISIRNKFGLNCVQVLAWSVIFLSPRTLIYSKPWTSWQPYIDGKKGYKRQKHPMNDRSTAFQHFELLGFDINQDFKRFILAWDLAIDRNPNSPPFSVTEDEQRQHLELVPFKSAENVGGYEDEAYDENGKYRDGYFNHLKRPYFIGRWTGPERDPAWRRYQDGVDIDWDDRLTLLDLERDRKSL